MRAFKRVLLIVGINLVLIASSFELAGNALYWFDGNSGIFYRRVRTLTSHEVRTNPWGVPDHHPILHPYFGFLYATSPGTAQPHGVHLNNHMFVQQRAHARQHPTCCDFPIRGRDPDEVIVAFFGGSVAGNVALTAQEDDRLSMLLKDAPKFRGKRIRTLNFAVGGHKQPQQLMILAYYLSLGQRFDAVINIDGFNEIVFGPANDEQGVAVGYPNPYQWLRLAAFLSEQAMRPGPAGVEAAYRKMMARKWDRWTATCRVATCYLLGRIPIFWYADGNATNTSPFPSAPSRDYVVLNPSTGDDALTQTADQWAESIRLMHEMLSGRGIQFLSIVQPNQWFRSGPSYQPRRAADEFTQRVVRSVQPGYRELLARVPALRAQGVAVLDETKLFDGESHKIYTDDCCHFSPAGNAMLLDVAAQWLTRQ